MQVSSDKISSQKSEKMYRQKKTPLGKSGARGNSDERNAVTSPLQHHQSPQRGYYGGITGVLPMYSSIIAYIHYKVYIRKIAWIEALLDLGDNEYVVYPRDEGRKWSPKELDENKNNEKQRNKTKIFHIVCERSVLLCKRKRKKWHNDF